MASEGLYCMECVEGRAVALGLCSHCLAGEPVEAVVGQIARLTRELEEAREREQAVRSAVIRAVAALVRLDLRWDPREEAEWVRRGPVVEIAMRLKDEVLALATPQEVSDGTTRWYCEYGCGCVLDSRAARYHDCRRPASDGGEVRERALRDDLTEAIGHLAALVDLLHHDGYPEHSDRAARLVSAAEIYLESPSREQEGGAATAEIANCRCAPGAPWRSDGATCPDWPGCGNPDWRPATPQEASGAD